MLQRVIGGLGFEGRGIWYKSRDTRGLGFEEGGEDRAAFETLPVTMCWVGCCEGRIVECKWDALNP